MRTVLLGVNAANGQEVSGASFELDANGYLVLRVIDAAPFGYDAVKDARRVLAVKKLVRSRNSYSTQVPATTGIETLTITPTAGSIARLSYLGISIPAIATATGNHELYVTVGTDNGYKVERLININLAGTSVIEVSANDVTQRDLLRGVIFDSTNVLQIVYKNGSNLAQGGTRMIIAVYEEEAVV